MKILHRISLWFRHFFHVCSNIRPIVWIGLYIALVPIFALIYWGMPAGQFRVPDGAGTDFGSWLYYSIVTITTLGFGDYTPAHGIAQSVTAIEVMCGLIFLGFFRNAVGSMKSEIDVASEKERQRQLHHDAEQRKLHGLIPMLIHNINTFLAYCYAVTTPKAKRGEESKYNPDFKFSDMADMFKQSGLPFDRTNKTAVSRLISSLQQTSLALDSLESRVDLTLWPEIEKICFSFVANAQMFTSEDEILQRPSEMLKAEKELSEDEAEHRLSKEIGEWEGPLEFKDQKELQSIAELYYLIRDNANLALQLESQLTLLSGTVDEN